jgi:outer membrane protein insertion porin family
MTAMLGFAQSRQDTVAVTDIQELFPGAQATLGDKEPEDQGGNTNPISPLTGNNLVCGSPDVNAVNVSVYFPRHSKNCVRLAGGFSNVPGSYVGLSYIANNLLHLGEVLNVNGEFSVRRHKVQLDFAKTSLFGKPIEIGFSVYGQRFSYNQARESSIFAFQRDIPQFQAFDPDNLLQYVSYSYGTAAFVRYRLRNVYRVGLTYTYDVSDITMLTSLTSDYFSYLSFDNVSAPHELSGIHTSKLAPSFSYTTLDSDVRPTRGVAAVISTGIAGLGGNVKTVEPAIEAKYFHSGLKKGHVIGVHLRARLIRGYGDHVAPPFDRYYAGGEDEIRGFESWSITPIAYQPGMGAFNRLNTDGTPLMQKTVDANGDVHTVNLQQILPIYRPVSIGGDTKVITNVEYRIPIGGPLTLALFYDAGVNRATFRDAVRLDPRIISALSSAFPYAALTDSPSIEPGTQKIRMSTGAELQFLPRRINVPLRFYAAYNPLIYANALHPSIVVDRSYFANQATEQAVLNELQAPIPLRERRFMFRFSIGRSF